MTQQQSVPSQSVKGNSDKTGNSIAVAGFTLSMVGFFIPIVGFILSILGIIFSSIGIRRAPIIGKGRGLSIAGLVIGILGFILELFFLPLFFGFVGLLFAAISDFLLTNFPNLATCC